MIIQVPPGALLRPADTDLSDLTDCVRTGPARWVTGGLEIPFEPEPSEAEQAAIRRRLLTRDADDEAEVAEMQLALANLADNPNELARGLKVVLRRLLGPLA